MPRITPRQAVDSVRRDHQHALSVITYAVLTSRSGREATSTVLSLAGGKNVPIRGGLRPLDLFVLLDVSVDQEDGEVKTDLTGYEFQLRQPGGPEMLAYHWHPDSPGFSEPHLHVSSGAGQLAPELQRAYLPTGSITLSQFVLMLIADFGVAPLRPDCAAVLGSGTK